MIKIDSDLHEQSEQLLNKINKYRIDNGVSPLVWNNLLLTHQIPQKTESLGQISTINKFDSNFAEIENIRDVDDVMNVAIQSWAQDHKSVNNILDNQFTDAYVNMECEEIDRPIRTVMSQIAAGNLR